MVDGTADHVKHVRETGYVIIPSVLDADTVARVRSQLDPYFIGQRGRNEFEGLHTERLYALLAKAPAVAELVEHPTALAITDHFLHVTYLLWGALAINNHPGETAQEFHADDDYVPESRPRPPSGVSTMWALGDFTASNGATQLIAGSHLWGVDETPRPDHPEIITAVMPAGSLMVWLGNVYHRGGANRSDTSRLGITVQYCQPWLRQIENMVLAVPPEHAARYSDRVQRMLGYGLFGGSFMGYVDGRDPKRLVDGSPGAGRTDSVI